LSISSQTKLLQFLESGTYFPLGEDSPKQADARIIVATNRDLNKLKANESFRSDLFFRLQTHHIHIPALRERRDDIPLLLEYFSSQAAAEFSVPAPTYTKPLYRALRHYDFPGNLRELRALIWDAVGNSLTGGSPSDLIIERLSFSDEMVDLATDTWLGDNLPTLHEATTSLIREALERSDGNISEAARTLGITPQALSQRLKRDKQCAGEDE
ncbi:hypothetical protein BVX99_03265, partial [bacterium F16]